MCDDYICHMKRVLPILLLFFLTVARFYAQPPKVVGYLPYYRFSLAGNIAFEKLTHLCIAFANPDSEGQLSVGGEDIAPIVAAGHQAGVEVFISLGGGAIPPAAAANWKELTKPQNRPAFIQKIVAFVIDYNLEGVDMDLEWGNVDANYSGFNLELRDSLDVYGKKLTAALPGTYRYPEISDEALFSFDFINVMAYDLTGPWAPGNPGQHSPYSYAVNSLDFWMAQGLPGESLTLGLPFYGYDFTNAANVVSFTYGSMVAEDPAYAQLDQVGLRYYNGIPTIEAKTELAKEQAAGVCIWELGQDAFNEYSLLLAIDGVLVVDAKATVAQTPVAVYPNPFGETLRIEGLGKEAVSVFLSHPDGRLIFERQVKTADIFSLDTSGLPPGMYFLGVKTGEAFQVMKVIKD